MVCLWGFMVLCMPCYFGWIGTEKISADGIFWILTDKHLYRQNDSGVPTAGCAAGQSGAFAECVQHTRDVEETIVAVSLGR